MLRIIPATVLLVAAASAAFGPGAAGLPGLDVDPARISKDLRLRVGASPPMPIPLGGAGWFPFAVDSTRVLADLRFLSSPELEGRGAGSAGNRAAREYIEAELRGAGVQPAGGSWTHPFVVGRIGGVAVEGANVIGWVRGTLRPDRFIVVTAHFDHLGNRGGTIYHGADDNASGTAALLEIARHFAANPARHSIVVAALDAEELGLRGARALVADPPVPLQGIVLNVNMDMVSRNEEGELWAAGTYHYPFLTGLVEEVAGRSELTLRMGHDRPGSGAGQDWTSMSDHAAFHEAGIPFVYFGVEDHADYHRPTDTFENVDPAFFVRAVRTILDFVAHADGALPDDPAATRE